MTDLMTCPFCNSKPKIGSLGGDGENWAIWCDCQKACVETGLHGDTKEEIIKAWNTRAEITAEQKMVDVERLKQDILYYLTEEVGHTRQVLLKTETDTVLEVIDHLSAKGYLRTPDTEKDRVLELMAGALKHWVQHSHHPCQLTDEALSEYEKLKGGA